jgi:exodeoxyribonuclease VII small subunit
MAKPRSTPKPVEELTYEETLAELEAIVVTLEGEQNPLEESIKLFERGQALVRRCGELLEAAELSIKQMAGGEATPFEDESA